MLRGLIDVVLHRDAAPPVTLPELVAIWGLRLAADEAVLVFSLAASDKRSGYILVTSERLAYFAQVSAREHRMALERPLRTIRAARCERGLLRSRLLLSGEDGPEVDLALAPSDGERIRDVLDAVRNGTNAED